MLEMDGMKVTQGAEGHFAEFEIREQLSVVSW